MRRKTWLAAAAVGAVLITAACSGSKQETPKPAAGPAAMDRTVLPIQEPQYPAVTELDARKAVPVTEDYKKGDNTFTGKIIKVEIDIGETGAGVKAEAAKAGAEAAKKLEEAK
jgi:hypothetical protein